MKRGYISRGLWQLCEEPGCGGGALYTLRRALVEGAEHGECWGNVLLTMWSPSPGRMDDIMDRLLARIGGAL